MKKLIALMFFVLSVFAYSQYVGINTTTPSTTLDIKGVPADASKADGLKIPSLSLAELNAKTSYGAAQKGTMIYINNVSGTTVTATSAVNKEGYYSYNGALWEPMIPNRETVYFQASLGAASTSGTDVNAVLGPNGFGTVPLQVVEKNLGGGIWNISNKTYRIPKSGNYLVRSTVRLIDNSAPRNIYQSVHTSNIDVPSGIWQTNGSPRSTMLYTNVSYYNEGDLLRLYIYSEIQYAYIYNAFLSITLL